MTEPKGQTKTLGIKLPPDLHAQFTLVAQMDKISLAEGVLRAVEMYVKTQSTAPDFADRATAAAEEVEREAAARRDAVQALFWEAWAWSDRGARQVPRRKVASRSGDGMDGRKQPPSSPHHFICLTLATGPPP